MREQDNDPFDVNENEFDFKKEFFKYLFFWRYFVLSFFLLLSISFIYLRYTPKIYVTNAKIKILDKTESMLELPSGEGLFSNTSVNVENQLEIIKSYPILRTVVENLKLTTTVYKKGKVTQSIDINYPFEIKLKTSVNEIQKFSYDFNNTPSGFQIINLNNNKKYKFKNLNDLKTNNEIPFQIFNIKSQKFNDDGYVISFSSIDNKVKFIKSNFQLDPLKNSDVVSLSFKSSNTKYSEIILNEIINVFNLDGINDRQLVHQRTIDFVNDRYTFLSSELDSVETNKQIFKKTNNLVSLDANSNISINESSKFRNDLFSIENQLYVVKSLIFSLDEINFELLPSNIGIDNNEINNLINEYNNNLISYKKIIASAGNKNPVVIQYENLIKEIKSNISVSLNNFLLQLLNLKERFSENLTEFDNQISKFPEKEKILRSIERNQQIKEALYLFLLQKREEAQVSLAVTQPTIKVVEYSISNNQPIFPRESSIYSVSLILAFLIPFLIIYLIFFFDDKIHSREDLDKYSLNVLGEIPFFDMSESNKVFTNPDDRSIISESFRMLMSNVRYLLKNDSSSNVILVSSSIKGEGKTLNALNLSLSFSSVGKKVLLIGCDLRNPQLHKYFNYDKNVPGLVDFLVDNKTEWRKNIINPFNSQSFNVLLSGSLPPNPLNLINNGNIDILLKDARKTYDYIIIDSAPTLLVADTKSLMNKSDVIILLTRCNVTDFKVLSHINRISKEYDANIGVVLNGVGQKNSYGYSYGYRYGYGYNYKYSYNYGYGYGYSSDDEKS